MNDLLSMTCAECCVPFGVTNDLFRRRKNDHNNFYCPNGHANIYPGEPAQDIEKRRADKEKARADKNWELYCTAQREVEDLSRELRRLRGEPVTNEVEQAIEGALGSKPS